MRAREVRHRGIEMASPGCLKGTRCTKGRNHGGKCNASGPRHELLGFVEDVAAQTIKKVQRDGLVVADDGIPVRPTLLPSDDMLLCSSSVDYASPVRLLGESTSTGAPGDANWRQKPYRSPRGASVAGRLAGQEEYETSLVPMRSDSYLVPHRGATPCETAAGPDGDEAHEADLAAPLQLLVPRILSPPREPERSEERDDESTTSEDVPNIGESDSVSTSASALIDEGTQLYELDATQQPATSATSTETDDSAPMQCSHSQLPLVAAGPTVSTLEPADGASDLTMANPPPTALTSIDAAAASPAALSSSSISSGFVARSAPIAPTAPSNVALAPLKRPSMPVAHKVPKRLCSATKYNEFPPESLTLGEKLGQGANATTYKVECSQMPGISLAAKRIDYLVESEYEDAVAQIRREFRALEQLNHSSIVRTFGVAEDREKSCVMLLTELMPLGSLRSRLDAAPSSVVDSPATQFQIASDVVCGMAHLHGLLPEAWTHGDLKSDNILLARGDEGAQMRAKLCDLGLVRNTGMTTACTTRAEAPGGTLPYRAPECFDPGYTTTTPESEVYAFGVVAFELLTAEKPWAGLHPFQIIGSLSRGDRPAMTPELADSALGQMAMRCWRQLPADRPTFRKLTGELEAHLKSHMHAAPSTADCAVAAARPEIELLVMVCSPCVSELDAAGPEAMEIASSIAAARGVASSVAAATSWADKVEILWGGTVDDLRKKLLAKRVKRFLFCGHGDAMWPDGNGVNALGTTLPGGHLELISPHAIVKLLTEQSSLELVFINGCCSEAFGRQLHAKGIPTVVCWRSRVHDEAAKAFSKEFFRQIARSRTPCEAFQDAWNKVVSITRPASGHVAGVGARVSKFEMIAPGQPSTSPAQPRPIAAGIPLLLDAHQDTGEEVTV